MKNDNLKNLKIVALLFCALVLFWALFSVRSRAASDQDYFPMEQNKNGHFSQEVIEAIANRYDDENYYIFVLYVDYNYRIIRYPKSEKVNGMICGEKNNNLYLFSLYMVGNINNCQGWGFQYMYGQIMNEVYYGSNPFGYFQNLQSSNYNSAVDYISNYIVYTNNTSSKQLVLLYDEQPEYVDPDNDTYPENFEQPKMSDYFDENDIPGYDDTDTASALESLYNIIKWGFGQGISGLLNYVVDSMNWGFQKIINNVRKVVTELQEAIEDSIDIVNGYLSDIKDWLDDFQTSFNNFADLFIHPFDEEEFEEQIENCQLISQYNELMDNCDDIRAILNNAVERDYFVLYIDFENPFADSEHKIIHSEISFTWLKDYRTTYRPFLWLFTMIECFVGGMRLLGGIIGGKAK